MEVRIEKQAEAMLDPDVLSQLRRCSRQLISGLPLLVVPAESTAPIRYFAECEPLFDYPVQVSRVGIKRIPLVGHAHVPSEYVCDIGYPVVTCTDDLGNEILIGMKPELQFEMQPAKEV